MHVLYGKQLGAYDVTDHRTTQLLKEDFYFFYIYFFLEAAAAASARPSRPLSTPSGFFYTFASCVSSSFPPNFFYPITFLKVPHYPHHDNFSHLHEQLFFWFDPGLHEHSHEIFDVEENELRS